MAPNSADPGPGTATRGQVALIHDAIERDVESLNRGIAVKIRKSCGHLRRDEVAERAVEVLDETVRRALARPESLDPERPVYPWLMGIAINVLLERGRGVARQRRQVAGTDLGDDAWRTLLDRLSYEPLDQIVADRIDLDQALERLDPQSRRVLECRYLRGLEGEELARAIGAPNAGAARVRVCRALQRLRDQFGPAHSEVIP